MALADKTRLRLLNLMRDEEVCVCFFTEVLGDSQPKISRHLAYLRNGGIVKARRDGKWMHYSIIVPDDEGGKRVLNDALNWLDDQQELRAEREKYKKVCCSPELLVQIARTPINFMLPTAEEEPLAIKAGNPETAQQAAVENEEPDLVYSYADTGHNEIDDYLL